MPKAYVFPGQGSQFIGIGQDLHEQYPLARERFSEANELLGFSISELMFQGTDEELKRTDVTQPAVFLHSVISAEVVALPEDLMAVAGHSLGEFSALVVSGALEFKDGLLLVKQRADAMEKACREQEGTMAAIVGLADEVVEEGCAKIEGVVIAANYNCPGQLVISGEVASVEKACEHFKEAGAMKVVPLAVDGAFHSPLMASAREDLSRAIRETPFKKPRCPIFQNVDGQPSTEPDEIRKKLIAQLTAPVRWTETIQQMVIAGVDTFVEVGGNGKVIRGMIRRIDRALAVEPLKTNPVD